MERLSYPQEEILRLISLYIEEHNGRLPYRENKWFVEKTRYEGNYITNVKGHLKDQGFVSKQMALTEKGRQYISHFFGPFTVHSAEIRVQGTAIAGPADSTVVQLDEFEYPSDQTISVPGTLALRELFAVNVIGHSMVALGIFPGDYAIVERRDSTWWPDPLDMIKARYLPYNPERSDDYGSDPSDYSAPVIKVYLKRFGEKGCHLGWKGSNEHNPFLIVADDLAPIGKVIGIYRDYQKFSRPFSELLDYSP